MWVKCLSVAITFHRLLLPSCSFYQVPVIVLRDGVEPNSFAVKLRSHRLPVYPAGVRGVDLSVWGADMGLMSLNGIKLVVTRLASPARIRSRHLVPGRYLRRIRVPKPCDSVTGLLYI